MSKKTQLVAIEEASKALSVSVRWIQNQMKNGRDPIPFHRKGRNVRFDLDEIIEWFKTSPKGKSKAA